MHIIVKTFDTTDHGKNYGPSAELKSTRKLVDNIITYVEAHIQGCQGRLTRSSIIN